MNQYSSIPGPKPPPSPLRETKQSVESESEQLDALMPKSELLPSRAKVTNPIQRLDNILNKPTSDILQEAGVVASVAVEESKTVGGLGLTALTIFALIAASPWSWIAALIFGPMRVWTFFNVAVAGGIGQVAALIAAVVLLLVFTAVLAVGWLLFR